MKKNYTANSIIIFENILFPSQCGFRKGFSAQNCLLVMNEKFKETIHGMASLVLF